MRKKRIIAALLPGLLIFSLQLIAQSPKNISKQTIWIKGDPMDKLQSLPSFNFNPLPAINDNNNRKSLPAGLETMRQATIFTVFLDPGTTEAIPVWEMSGDFGDITLSTNRITVNDRKTTLTFPVISHEKQGAFIHTYTRRKRSQLAPGNDRITEPSIRMGISADP